MVFDKLFIFFSNRNNCCCILFPLRTVFNDLCRCFRWSQFQLYLPFQSCHFRFELLEFLFLFFFSCTAYNLPQCWQILFQFGILRFVRLYQFLNTYINHRYQSIV